MIQTMLGRWVFSGALEAYVGVNAKTIDAILATFKKFSFVIHFLSISNRIIYQLHFNIRWFFENGFNGLFLIINFIYRFLNIIDFACTWIN